MPRITLKLLRKHRSKLTSKEQRQKSTLNGAILTVTTAAAAISASVATSVPKSPVRTSILTGEIWLAELFLSPVRMDEQLGVTKHLFRQLSKELRAKHGLSDGKYVSANEQLAIFLHFARTGASSRMLQERFQRSGETISKQVFKSYLSDHECSLFRI
jgi:hypothetical protein